MTHHGESFTEYYASCSSGAHTFSNLNLAGTPFSSSNADGRTATDNLLHRHSYPHSIFVDKTVPNEP